MTQFLPLTFLFLSLFTAKGEEIDLSKIDLNRIERQVMNRWNSDIIPPDSDPIYLSQINSRLWFSSDQGRNGSKSNYEKILSNEITPTDAECNNRKWNLSSSEAKSIWGTGEFWRSSTVGDGTPGTYQYYMNGRGSMSKAHFLEELNQGNWDPSFERFCLCTYRQQISRDTSQDLVELPRIAPCKLFFSILSANDVPGFDDYFFFLALMKVSSDVHINHPLEKAHRIRFPGADRFKSLRPVPVETVPVGGLPSEPEYTGY